jgi:hypothetical protein
MKNPDSRPPRIGNPGHVIHGAGDLAMPATGALGVIDLYRWHGRLSQKDVGVIDSVRKRDFPPCFKRILDIKGWMLGFRWGACELYPASSIQHPVSASNTLTIAFWSL